MKRLAVSLLGLLLLAAYFGRAYTDQTAAATSDINGGRLAPIEGIAGGAPMPVIAAAQ